MVCVPEGMAWFKSLMQENTVSLRNQEKVTVPGGQLAEKTGTQERVAEKEAAMLPEDNVLGQGSGALYEMQQEATDQS